MRARSHSALNDNFITETARCHQRQHHNQEVQGQEGGTAGTAASAIHDAPKKPSKRCRNVKCNKKLEGINAAAGAGQQVELQIPLCKEGCLDTNGIWRISMVYISTYIYGVSVRSMLSLAFVVCMNYVPDMEYILPILGMLGICT